MPDLAPFHSAIVFVHVLGVFLFLLAHGVSAGVMLRLRSERNPHAVRTLVDLSAQSINVMGLGAAMWLFSGVAAGFSGNYWTGGRLWIWASLVIAIAVVAVMTPLGRTYLNRVRVAVRIDPQGKSSPVPEAELDPAALEAAIASGRPLLLAAIGVGSVVILTWLMMFKPF